MAVTTPVNGRVRFGTAVPQIFPDGIDLSVIRDCVTHADTAGFDSLWVMESGIKQNRAAQAVEPLALLAYAAALTESTRLGTSVLVTAFRHPVQLATDLASLDQLSGGRLIVGVGRGHPRRGHLFGHSPDGWTERFEEGLEVVRRLWEPGTATHSGRYWQFEDLAMEPKPAQRPHPPIWFGAKTTRSLRRAVRLGSGWMGAGSSSTDDFVHEAGLLQGILAEEGTAGTGFVVSKRIYLAIEDGTEGVEPRVRDFFGHAYGRPDEGPRCAVWGPPEHCAEEIDRLVAAGADLVVANPMFDHRRQLDLFTESVLPLVDR